MEAAYLFIAYVLVLVCLVVALWRTAKRPSRKKWLLLYLTEILSICAAYCLMHYFDGLPGHGPLAGITYFAEVLYSLGAVAVYTVVLAVSVIVGAVVWLRKE